MFYIVGLGNPGKEYEHTRHNVGFLVLKAAVEQLHFTSLFESSAYSGSLSEGSLKGQEVTVLFPNTFMNDSGSAVKKLVSSDQSAQLMVVYDDIDIPFGEIKVSFGRGDGGHNGIKSIIASLGTKDFVRIRIGIGAKSLWTGKLKRPKGERLSKYVLGTFSSKELQQLEHTKLLLEEAITTFVSLGKEKLMTRFNAL